MSIFDLTALELGATIGRGEVSILEVTRAALDAAEKGGSGAFITRTAEEAERRARQLQQQLGKECGPLYGVPMALKDNLCTKGIRTTCGSRILADFCPPYDAAVMERLAQVGAVCVGKTNMDEFAMGSTSEASFFGPVRNPWRGDRVSGGSSGGSAAAVAEGSCWYALGSDTGGSVRQPAAWCGLTGMKPTYGTVSRFGLVAYASSFDQVGPLCRDAADCAAVLDVIQGQDPRDSTSVTGAYGRLLSGLTGDVRGLRVGLPVQCFGDGLAEEVRAQVLAVADVLCSRGAVVEECSLPELKYAVPAYYVMACAQASSNLARYDGVRFGWRAPGCESVAEVYEKTRTQGFGAEVKRRVLLGTFVLSAGFYDDYYRKAEQARQMIRGAFDRLFRRYDLLLTPVTAGSAPRLGESLDDPAGMYQRDIYTVCANLAGLPALSMPCGMHHDGVPMGVQLMGRPFGDGTALRAAHAYQQETDWHRRHVWSGGGAG